MNFLLLPNHFRCVDPECIMAHKRDRDLEQLGFQECDLIKLFYLDNPIYKKIIDKLLDHELLTHHGYFRKIQEATEYVFNFEFTQEIKKELELIDKGIRVGGLKGDEGKYLLITLKD